MKRLALLALAAGVLAACDQAPTSPTSYGRPSLAAGGNSGPSATGAGHFDQAGELRTFSFNAITKKDGTVNGHAELHNRLQDTRLHIDVNCLRVVGNVAIMSGVVTNSNDPTLVGDETLFSVQDNGEGAKAPPDLISLVFLFPPGSGFSCDLFAVAPTNAIEGGNVQVRP